MKLCRKQKYSFLSDLDFNPALSNTKIFTRVNDSFAMHVLYVRMLSLTSPIQMVRSYILWRICCVPEVVLFKSEGSKVCVHSPQYDTNTQVIGHVFIHIVPFSFHSNIKVMISLQENLHNKLRTPNKDIQKKKSAIKHKVWNTDCHKLK